MDRKKSEIRLQTIADWSEGNGQKMSKAVDEFRRTPNDSAMQAIVDKAVRGKMENDEIARLALVLGQSGDNQPFCLGSISADLASTGGPSSLSTLLGAVVSLLYELLCSEAGRSRSSQLGGVDTLAQIPGYKVSLTSQEVSTCIEECGYAHFLADSSHAPLDAKLFGFRQSVGAQNVPELVIASILAKKVAVGLDRAGLDIRVAPHGNFGATWEQARINGKRFCKVAKKLGISAISMLTDGTIPYQRYVGRGESLLALRNLFLGTADSYLWSHAMQCLAMASTIASVDALTLANSIENASKRFVHNLQTQGSSWDAFEDYASRIERSQGFHLTANATGFVRVHLKRLREVVMHYQRLGAPKGDIFPDQMGLVLMRLPGEFVQPGDLLATVRIAKNHWNSAQVSIAEAIEIGTSATREKRFRSG